MNKVFTVLGKNTVIALLGVIVVAGLVYVEAGKQKTTAETSEVVPVISAKSAVTGNDSDYVNTQWNDAVGGTKGMPENWPKDAPRAYSGAMLMASLTKDPGTGKQNPSVNYFTNVSGVEVTDYYVKGLNENGWKIEANADSPAGYRVITAKKDTRSFYAFISVVQVEGKTGVTSGVTF